MDTRVTSPFPVVTYAAKIMGVQISVQVSCFQFSWAYTQEWKLLEYAILLCSGTTVTKLANFEVLASISSLKQDNKQHSSYAGPDLETVQFPFLNDF